MVPDTSFATATNNWLPLRKNLMPSGPTSTGTMLITVGCCRIADIDQRNGIGAFEPDRD